MVKRCPLAFSSRSYVQEIMPQWVGENYVKHYTDVICHLKEFALQPLFPILQPRDTSYLPCILNRLNNRQSLSPIHWSSYRKRTHLHKPLHVSQVLVMPSVKFSYALSECLHPLDTSCTYLTDYIQHAESGTMPYSTLHQIPIVLTILVAIYNVFLLPFGTVWLIITYLPHAIFFILNAIWKVQYLAYIRVGIRYLRRNLLSSGGRGVLVRSLVDTRARVHIKPKEDILGWVTDVDAALEGEEVVCAIEQEELGQ
jgi:hypothetical protein